MKLFIDGKEGTTGLRIFQRLQGRTDLEIIQLPEECRKDVRSREEAINASDIVLLCLPDEAARESVSLLHRPQTRVLDTSTAHRTQPGWAYGFPELSTQHREAISSGRFVAVPGCHASGFVALITPLLAAGLLSPDAPLACYSLTGYSGGGKRMIAQYETPPSDPMLASPRVYGLGQQHKHLREMQMIPGLAAPPIFSPIVAPYYSGMLVLVPLHSAMVHAEHPKAALWECLASHYAGSPVVHVLSEDEVNAWQGFLPAHALTGKDSMELMVLGNDDRLQLGAWFDNLGKGASGAAIQCLNLMLGLSETMGLSL